MKNATYYGVALCMSISFFLTASEQKMAPWTWFYQKNMSETEAVENGAKKELVFLRDSLDPFTQLLFSWNAFRPEQGYISFWVQARDKTRQTWGMWHKMMEWGVGIQRSFMTPTDNNYARYIHVRLETQKGKSSDAFRIKIKAHDGATLDHVKSFAVSLSNFESFAPEDVDQLADSPSVYVHKVPKYSQFMLDHPRNDSLCSPTSTSILTSYLMNQEVNPLQFAQNSYDEGLQIYGSWPFNVAHAFELCKGNFWFAVARFNSFRYILAWLKNNIPVVVSVRGPLKGSARPYANGHLLVVVGFDAKKKEVICHDPAFETDAKTKHRYAIQDFLEAWERSKRLVYIAGPAIPSVAT